PPASAFHLHRRDRGGFRVTNDASGNADGGVGGATRPIHCRILTSALLRPSADPLPEVRLRRVFRLRHGRHGCYRHFPERSKVAASASPPGAGKLVYTPVLTIAYLSKRPTFS